MTDVPNVPDVSADPKVIGPVAPDEDVPEASVEVIDELTGGELVQLLKLLLTYAASHDQVADEGYLLTVDGSRHETITLRTVRGALREVDRYALVLRRHRTFDSGHNQAYELQLIDRRPTVARQPAKRKGRSPNR